MQIPVVILGLCVSLYWGTVIVKALRLKREIKRQPNIIPKEKLGLYLRIIWAPVIIGWQVAIWSEPTFVYSNQWLHWLAWMGTFIAFAALRLSFICWSQMGRAWRIGIDPNETTQLITSGAFSYTLHPIYSLSMLLALATLFIIPTLKMAVLMLLHIGLLYFEAIREERDMLKKHGEAYAAHQTAVGRFIPKFRRATAC